MARVKTEMDLFSAKSDFMAVVSLIRFFTSDRHQWRSLTLATVNAVEQFFAVNAPTLCGSIGVLARKAWTTEAAWTSTAGRSKQHPVYEVSAATVEDVLVDLGRPGVLVVEDLVSDRAFLDALVHVFGDVRVALALDHGWLEIRHAGGGGRVIAVAEDEAQKFMVIARVGSMIDSDSLYPGHRTRAYATAEHLGRLGLDCHVLAYREIENYIPNRAFATIRPPVETHRRLRALRSLDHLQRGHLDMKKGLGRRNGRFARMPQEHQNLYSSIPDSVLAELEDGFGDNVICCLERAAAGMTVQDYASLGVGVHGELVNLLFMLRSLI